MTDREAEIEKRRQRAQSESFSIAPIPSQVVKKFLVKGKSGRGYQVTLDQEIHLKTCECHDFLNAGLGTCKHIEAVLLEQKISLPGPSMQPKILESTSPVGKQQAVISDFQLSPSPAPSESRSQHPDRSGRHLVCFDVETQNSFDDVGGRQNFDKLRISVAVLYDELLHRYFVYNEQEAAQLIDHLFTADLVVGYNIAGFDYAVIQPYTDRDVKRLPTLDLMFELTKRLGFRVKLDSVVNATLGAKKSGHGLQAIEWFRRGEMEKLTRYCRDDVKLTYDLFRFGAANGFVYIDSRGARQRVPVEWK